jgi:hypothetical protein
MLALPRDPKRLLLVLVESEVFVEKARRFGQDYPFACKALKVGAALKGWIELKDRIGPKAALVEFPRDKSESR